MSIQIPAAFEFLFHPMRFKVPYGGRGSAKSWNIARALLIKAAQEKLSILCTRELQASIQDSVHRLLSNQIEELGLSDFYEVLEKNIRGKNGSIFTFKGLRNNYKEIKSTEGIDIAWCEEAESISEASWDALIPTIRKDGSEIWVSFNPGDELDNTYQRYVISPPQNCISKRVSWRDNPWFPEELRKEMEECKEKNYKKYLHIWEGECNANYEDSIIQPEWVDAAIDAHIKLGFKPLGVRSMGFDPADIGEDNKAIAVRHGSVIENIQDWSEGNVSDAIDKAFQIAFDARCDFIVYDNIGVGAAVKVGLDKRIAGKKITIRGFCGSAKTDEPSSKYENDKINEQMFSNLRAQYWWYMRDRFEKTFRAVTKNEYINPEELISLSSSMPKETLSKVKSELSRVQRKRGANSFIQIESKKDMVARRVKSPNMSDALAMCFANQPPAKVWSNITPKVMIA